MNQAGYHPFGLNSNSNAYQDSRRGGNSRNNCFKKPIFKIKIKPRAHCKGHVAISKKSSFSQLLQSKSRVKQKTKESADLKRGTKVSDE